MDRTSSPENVETVLSADHLELDQVLTRLLDALKKREANAAFAHLDLFWARLAMHIRGENLHLFPAISGSLQSGDSKEVSSREALQAIDQLKSDHEYFMHELADAVKLMRDRNTDETTIERVRQSITTLRKRLEAHNKLEEEVVYRLPANLLEPEEQATLEASVRKELENLPPRFRDTAS